MLKRATTKYYLIQSFSDVITNSSSETYVVDTSYTAKALQRALEAIHKQHENAEYYSGECCGIEVSDFKESPICTKTMMSMVFHSNLRKNTLLGPSERSQRVFIRPS